MLGELLDHALVVVGVRVQPRARGRAADTEAAQALGRNLDALHIVAHGPRVGGELLPQPHGHGILEVRAPRLDHVVELQGLRLERVGEVVDCGQQLPHAPKRPEPDGGRDGVVGALGHVDVVVGADGLLRVA
jgi:hypothetical protein